MKNFVKILLAIFLIIGLFITYRFYKTSEIVNNETDIKIDLIQKEDVEKYFDEFMQVIYNTNNIDIDDLNLISPTLYNSLNVLQDEEETTSDYSDIDLFYLEREINKNGEYPIINRYGQIYKYGTEKDSDKSFEIYKSQPKYDLMHYEIKGNTLTIKYFDRPSMSTYICNLYLDKDKKIESYEFI